MKPKDRLLAVYVRRMLKRLGPDEVAKVVIAEFNRAAYKHHIRRHL